MEETNAIRVGARRRRIVIVLVTCVLVGIVVATFWPEEKEPEYNGKKLSEWLRIAGKGFWTTGQGPFHTDFDANTAPEVKEALQAVRITGTIALPCLLKWAEQDDEKWENWVFKTGRRLPQFLHPDSIISVLTRYAGRKQNAALIGFTILGQKAAPAVPELEALVEKSKSEHCRLVAIYCLGVMGEAARPVLPCLKKHAMVNGARERFWTVRAITEIEGGNPGMAGTNAVAVD